MKPFSVDQILEDSNKLDMEGENAKLYYTCFVTLVRIPQNLFYKACINDRCKKKVFENGDQYECHSCGEVFDHFKPRFLSNLKFSDSTNEIWITTIGDKDCRVIFGLSEQELFDKK